ncbi:hypothetical protein LY01_02867 [Nonlabens xylanidelens]|uniref:Uncharacterized protein n=1 Tax=Nonlabens xylanidelens TaxID=191564 RepID=A0A2S6IF00_9FLAO|nr:hypothetical protein [Nonlabens xylanidelens]PPK92781.1 hypothetical protein LY01_02867 [Nonlabens xylanidelens]PQJ19826.1 hypothetical protein BST94_06170 [Nonlabens xylanidelens]
MIENKDILKNSVLEDYKFYDRRYEQISLIVAGFGLYGCLEFSKMLIKAQESLTDFVLTSAILFGISVVLSLFNLRIEKQIRAYYVGLLLGYSETKKESILKSIRLENIGKISSWINLIVMIAAILYLVLSAVEVHNIIY